MPSRPADASARGVLLCLLSACGFGAMAIFAKDAYGAGASVMTLLAARFVLACGAFWAIAAARGSLRVLRAPGAGKAVAIALVVGGLSYAAQAGLFYGALTRLDASLTSLLLYTYPAVVFCAALALGRERATPQRVTALSLGTAGAALVLLGGAGGAGLDAAGVAMALGAAVTYASYILLCDRLVARLDPFALAALVSTGAAVSLVGAGLGSGGIDLHLAPHAWLDIAAISVVSTVLPVIAFFAGMRRVGPATASIASTVEPVVTVGLAMACFGETLGALQALGAASVVGAVVALQLRGRVRGDVAPAPAARRTPARALAGEPARG